MPTKLDKTLTQPICIPKLTDLTQGHPDPDLGQFVHINRIYMFPVVEEELCVPQIAVERRLDKDLPRLEEINTREK